MRQLKADKVSAREIDKITILSTLDGDSLKEMLDELRSNFYCRDQVKLNNGPRFDQRVDHLMTMKLGEKYKDITDEEKDRCRNFIKNFVFSGD